MRGKKTDAEFISEFIVECARNGITNSLDVAKMAELQISSIDEKIKEVESLKRKRSKLIDVVTALSIKVKDKSDDKKALEFYQLSDLQTAASIARYVQDTPGSIDTLNKDHLHLVKEMLSSKILRREGSCLAQGIEYLNFLDFLSQVSY